MTRILAFSDIHNDWTTLRTLLQENADCYVCAGDLTYNEKGMREAYEIMRQKLDKIYIVPGNNERLKTIATLFPKHIHSRVLECGGLRIGGIGGAVRTPWRTMFDWDEDYAYKVLERLGETDIFVSHGPPRGTVLARTADGKDVGSEAIRWYIDTFQPKYAIVGHVHERAGYVEKVGKTTVLNAGRKGKMLILENEEPR